MGEITFHPEALAELRDAAGYYESCRTGLGSGFLSAFDDAIDGVCLNPQMGQTIQPPYRRWLVGRFPYGIIYREREDAIYILALMHLKRMPGYWILREEN
jgi:toxin ParE1/3/4